MRISARGGTGAGIRRKKNMDKQQALKQLRIMQAWHEDNGDGPNADYDAICFAIGVIEEQPEEMDTIIKALEDEHKKLLELQDVPPEKCEKCMMEHMDEMEKLEVELEMQKAQPEIIHCKDCVKHNKGVGDLEVLPDGKRSWIWKDQACPLVSWRGKAQGHEFDYQYCAYAERRTDG